MNNINPNTQTAEIKGPQAAQPDYLGEYKPRRR